MKAGQSTFLTPTLGGPPLPLLPLSMWQSSTVVNRWSGSPWIGLSACWFISDDVFVSEQVSGVEVDGGSWRCREPRRVCAPLHKVGSGWVWGVAYVSDCDVKWTFYVEIYSTSRVVVSSPAKVPGHSIYVIILIKKCKSVIVTTFTSRFHG